MYIHEHPMCWEQKALFYITTPIQAVASLVYLILTPVYMVLGILNLPLMILTLAMSAVWLPILGAILLFGKISRRLPSLRPISFLLALPFLVVGHFFVSLEPIVVPGDQEGKLAKLRLIERFPYATISEYPA
jgi:hypothetical protein